MIPDDVWALFACDDGPGGAWVAGAVFVLLLPVVGLLGCLLWSLIWPGREG